MSILDVFRAREVEPLPKGVYHYNDHSEFKGMRLHLRIEDEGAGILIVNASRILYMNNTATELLKMMLDGKSKDEVIKTMTKRYKVKKEIVEKDFEEMKKTIKSFIEATDVDPETNMTEDAQGGMPAHLSAPFKACLALTYKCKNSCIFCGAKKRNVKELKVEDWKKIIDKLWNVGVPHIIFTGGEPTEYEGLVELIEHAEKTGIITGLFTNGIKLKDNEYLKKLVDAGLDHFQIRLESHDEKIHNKIVGAETFKDTIEGIKNAEKTPIFLMTTTTLVPENVGDIEKTIEFIKSLGVKVFACNAKIYDKKPKDANDGFEIKELEPILKKIAEIASKNDMRFIWYSPTPYDKLNPKKLGLGKKQCGAANVLIAVEPDGTVLPCQTYPKPIGNLLTDGFYAIWNSQEAVRIRERQFITDRCKKCGDLPTCGGGCPVLNDKGKFICSESISA